jgi:hypothetical protein
MIHMKIFPSELIRVTVSGVFACGGKVGNRDEQEKTVSSTPSVVPEPLFCLCFYLNSSVLLLRATFVDRSCKSS